MSESKWQPTPNGEDRKAIPPRETVEDWLRRAWVDLDWFYDFEAGTSPPYRWARSGLDSMHSSQPEIGPHGGDVNDPTELKVRGYKVSDVRRAGWLIQDATRCLARARQLLSIKESRIPAAGVPVPGFIRKAEYEALLEKQRLRRAQGSGYGDA